MNAKQIQALGAMLAQADEVGLVLIGGARALVSMFHARPTDAELDAIETAVVADAKRRKSESNLMSGDAVK